MLSEVGVRKPEPISWQFVWNETSLYNVLVLLKTDYKLCIWKFGVQTQAEDIWGLECWFRSPAFQIIDRILAARSGCSWLDMVWLFCFLSISQIVPKGSSSHSITFFRMVFMTLSSWTRALTQYVAFSVHP